MTRSEDKNENVSIVTGSVFFRVLAFAIDTVIFKLFVLLSLIILSLLEVVPLQETFYILQVRANLYEELSYFTSVQDLWIHIVISLFFLAYFTILESRVGLGKTFGKMICRLEVVGKDGDAPSLKDSFLRNSTKYLLRMPVIGIPFGLFEIILLFIYSTRTGDMLADTVVASGVHKGNFTSVEEGEGYN
ncbi:MAG: RDD family protein [Candidatus Thermoplasmatota archaeon]